MEHHIEGTEFFSKKKLRQNFGSIFLISGAINAHIAVNHWGGQAHWIMFARSPKVV
jgi:hypothetical protein